MHDVKSENFHGRLELGLKLGLALVSIKPSFTHLAKTLLHYNYNHLTASFPGQPG